jgi:hypothetical protein
MQTAPLWCWESDRDRYFESEADMIAFQKANPTLKVERIEPEWLAPEAVAA